MVPGFRPVGFLAAGIASALLGAAAPADQIVAKGAGYPGSSIQSCQQGVLRVRLADDRIVNIPVADVDLLFVDRPTFDDFNEAERLMGSGDVLRAITRYERAQRLATQFWVEVIQARLLAAYDRGNQLDNAVRCFVQLAQGRFVGTAGAARLIPKAIPAQRNAQFARAVRELETVLSTKLPPDQQTLFTLLRFDLLNRLEDRRRRDAALATLDLEYPASVRTPAVYSILAAALAVSLESDSGADQARPIERVLEALDRAMETCPDENLPDFLLLKGRTLLSAAVTRDEIRRASWPYLRVAIHMPDDPRAAEGLLGGAEALDRLGQKDRAVGLLTECVAKDGASPRVRRDAESMLARLGGKAGRD